MPNAKASSAIIKAIIMITKMANITIRNLDDPRKAQLRFRKTTRNLYKRFRAEQLRRSIGENVLRNLGGIIHQRFAIEL